MKVAFGWKAHSGWAALVVIGRRNGEWSVVDRRRIELVDEEWARQPYHAAETLPPDKAREVVARGIAAAQQCAGREMQAAIQRERERGNAVSVCAVLVGKPMPEWNVDEILAVHFRMHKAEGALFRDVLTRAAETCGLRTVTLAEDMLPEQAEMKFQTTTGSLAEQIKTLGQIAGPPWGKDQKEATLAAMIALQRR